MLMPMWSISTSIGGAPNRRLPGAAPESVDSQPFPTRAHPAHRDTPDRVVSSPKVFEAPVINVLTYHAGQEGARSKKNGPPSSGVLPTRRGCPPAGVGAVDGALWARGWVGVSPCLGSGRVGVVGFGSGDRQRAMVRDPRVVVARA